MSAKCPECSGTVHHWCKEVRSYTSVLRDLHWLSLQPRIIFKIATLMCQCLNGLAPPYLAGLYRNLVNAKRQF